MTRVMRVVQTRSELATVLDSADRQAVRVVVPTMGALHDGHARLVEYAREHVGENGIVIVTVFVNPTQFAANEDFDRYPRSLDADVDLCTRNGADLVFAPDVTQMYPMGETQVSVDPGPVGSLIEGAVRPGHFRGVLTVVNKLFNLTRAQVAFFGEKDYQQLVLIRRMARDLSMEVDVRGVPTVREPDGLAMSSRNRYLDEAERRQAKLIPDAIDIGRSTAQQGGSALDVVADVEKFFDEHNVTFDYVVVTDPDLGQAPSSGEGRLIMAARIGSVRLLDNASISLGGSA